MLKNWIGLKSAFKRLFGKPEMKKINNSKFILPDEQIISKIFLIRDEKAMLDRDLAELFEVKAIRLREQVRRNKDKFPANFMFQ